jgi:hypothetical protein
MTRRKYESTCQAIASPTGSYIYIDIMHFQFASLPERSCMYVIHGVSSIYRTSSLPPHILKNQAVAVSHPKRRICTLYHPTVNQKRGHSKPKPSSACATRLYVCTPFQKAIISMKPSQHQDRPHISSNPSISRTPSTPLVPHP